VEKKMKIVIPGRVIQMGTIEDDEGIRVELGNRTCFFPLSRNELKDVSLFGRVEITVESLDESDTSGVDPK
jgi:hypothetical protein